MTVMNDITITTEELETLAQAIAQTIAVETQDRRLVLVFSNPVKRDDARRVVLDFLGFPPSGSWVQ